MPVFTEPLPAIHVPPNQKPGWCSRRSRPRMSSPQPANAGEDGRAATCRAVDAALAAEPHTRGEGAAGYERGSQARDEGRATRQKTKY